MDRVPVLRGEHVVLRPPQPSDRLDRLACGRHAEYVRMVGGDYRNVAVLTEDEADRWYSRLASSPCCWIIEAEGRCVGHARLHQLDEEHRRARYAIGIFDPSAWGRGFGSDATRLVLCYAFDSLRLHRVDLRVLTYNQRAIACYEKCGFVREGVEREGALIAGEWQSDLMMSILDSEYRDTSKAWPRSLSTD